MKDQQIYILTEAGAKIGMGHFVRCAALYDRLEEMGCCPKFFISTEDFSYASNTFAKYHHEFSDYTQDIPSEISNRKCIVDSYLASEETISAITEMAYICLFIDDNAIRKYPKGIIVNPNLYSSMAMYEEKKELEYLLGERYVILRKEFRYKHNKCFNKSIRNISVMMGGTDPNNFTEKILKGIIKSKINFEIINVVLHEDSVAYEKIRQMHKKINLLSNVSADKMVELMLDTDIFISAGGQTVNELVQLKIPSLLIKAVENQNRNVNYVVSNNMALEIDSADIERDTADKLRQMNEKTRWGLVENMKEYDFSMGVDNILNKFLNI